jgi:hypothetical protein
MLPLSLKDCRWTRASMFTKRISGFASYALSALVSLFIPIETDKVMFSTLHQQFKINKPDPTRARQQHILNAMKILERRAQSVLSTIGSEGAAIVAAKRLYPVYQTLCDELKRRLEGKPEPETRNRAITLED